MQHYLDILLNFSHILDASYNIVKKHYLLKLTVYY